MATTTNIFGLLASGRLVRTDFLQIDITHYTIAIYDIDSLSHIAVFLTGSAPLPEGTAGLVYFSWSENGVIDNWQLLGSISNVKPSAFFKISHVKQEKSTSSFGFLTQDVPTNCIAKVGISVEPMEAVNQQMNQLASNSFSNPAVATNFARKMLENFLNYASSFAAESPELPAKNDNSMVPLNILQNWYQNFERKLSLDPNFWKV